LWLSSVCGVAGGAGKAKGPPAILRWRPGEQWRMRDPL